MARRTWQEVVDDSSQQQCCASVHLQPVRNNIVAMRTSRPVERAKDQQGYIVDSVNEWVSLLGPRHVVVGFGISNETNYMSIDEAVPTWNELESNHPTLRGAFDWKIHLDVSCGWPFADGIGPLVHE